ncbi:MAG: hypothetical protein LQ338_002246 [Usnochroma carphineum]|nr:MAG: hypothetical protein LQ338_002246 [Usnochroma carphineum]
MQLSTWLAKAGPTTWLLIGGCLQCLLALVLPLRLIILLAALLLAIRLALSTRKTDKPLQSALPFQRDIRKGRWTAQIPHEDGSVVQRGSETEVVVFVVGASSSQYASSLLEFQSAGLGELTPDYSPMKLQTPEFKQLTQYFRGMWDEVESDRQKWGFLGRSSPLVGSTPAASTTVITLSYWKNLASLHDFALSPAHRAGWNWWNRTIKDHGHMGIMHEVYAAPKGHWENIYVNFRPFGMGQMQFVDVDAGAEEEGNGVPKERLKGPLIEAKGGRWGSMVGRMSRAEKGVEDIRAG